MEHIDWNWITPNYYGDTCHLFIYLEQRMKMAYTQTQHSETCRRRETQIEIESRVNFKWEKENWRKYYESNVIFLEPVNSVIPKLTTGDKSRTIDGRFNESITLLCPVQSSPLPNFK